MNAFHFVLPAPSPAPIGGYKVVYEYANALTRAGVAAVVWHAPVFNALSGTGLSVRQAAVSALGVVRGRVRRHPSDPVPWFSIDDRVSVRVSAGFPRPSLDPSDVVVATAVETTRFAGALARKAGATSLALIQHYETWAFPAEQIRRSWSAVDERVVIAPWLEELCTEAGLSSVLLPNALDTESFPAGPALTDRAPMVLSLLSPHEYKRPDVVAAALNSIAIRRPEARVVAFGTQESPPAELVAAVQYVSDPSAEVLRDLYRSATVYLCGSDAEGWHLPPAEATLSGAAVVSTDIGGVRASMGEDALYAPAGDAERLVDLALEVLRDPAPAQHRVDAAGTRLRSVTYESNVRRLLQVADGARGSAS